MAKHIKLFIGVVIQIVTGISGFVIWQFAQDSIKMARNLKDTAGIVFLCAFIPSLIFFVVWYFGCVKANMQIGKNRPSKWPYFLFGIITIWAVAVGCSLGFFSRAIVWAIVTAIIATIGSLVSYLIGEPR